MIKIAQEARLAYLESIIETKVVSFVQREIQAGRWDSQKEASISLGISGPSLSHLDIRMPKMSLVKSMDILDRLGIDLSEIAPDRRGLAIAIMKATLQRMRETRRKLGEDIPAAAPTDEELNEIYDLADEFPAVSDEDYSAAFERWFRKTVQDFRDCKEAGANHRDTEDWLAAEQFLPYQLGVVVFFCCGSIRAKAFSKAVAAILAMVIALPLVALGAYVERQMNFNSAARIVPAVVLAPPESNNSTTGNPGSPPATGTGMELRSGPYEAAKGNIGSAVTIPDNFKIDLNSGPLAEESL